MDTDEKTADFFYRGQLEGHNGWVTSLVTGNPQADADSNLLVSGSRDKNIIIWRLLNDVDDTEATKVAGYPYKAMTGHNHFISDLSLSQDNSYLLSASWDKTVRLWDLRTQQTTRRFVGHTKEVYTVSFSADNRQIISAGADKGIKLWNTLAQCKFTSETSNHSDWVSSVRYSPLRSASSKDNIQPYFTSVGWDGKLKVWNTNFQIRYSFQAHESAINHVAVSPNRRYIATGGKDKNVNVWDLLNLNSPIRSFDAGCNVSQLAFNPGFQMVATATDNGVKIYDILAKEDSSSLITTLTHEVERKSAKADKTNRNVACTSIAWNSLGNRLFAGFADGIIKVWDVSIKKKN